MQVKTIVITGSTRGIGHGLALEFLKLGHQVVINGTSDASLNKALAQLGEYKSQLFGVSGTITESATINSILNETINHFGQIDIWINNAGIAQPYFSTWDLSEESIKHSVDVNILGLIECTRRVYKTMSKQGFGKIFNMEGMGSDGRMTDKLSIYGTTKRAVNYFTKAFAREADKHGKGVQVCVLSPGIVITDFLKSSLEEGTKDEQKSAKKIFNILGDKVETVTPILTKRILQSTKNYDCIIYLTNRKASWRFLRSMFVKRKLI